MLDRVDLEVAGASAPLDGRHHGTEERQVSAVSGFDVVLTFGLLRFDKKSINSSQWLERPWH